MKQKSENQKALPKFFKLLAVAGLIGGVLGSLSSVAGYFWQEHDLGAAFARMLNAGSLWGMLVCSAVLLGIGLRLYRSARNAFRSWDGEDETVMEQADEQLSWAMMLENLTMIVSFFCFSVGTAGIADGQLRRLVPLLVLFIAVLALAVLLQQKTVDLVKEMNPEKKAASTMKNSRSSGGKAAMRRSTARSGRPAIRLTAPPASSAPISGVRCFWET